MSLMIRIRTTSISSCARAAALQVAFDTRLFRASTIERLADAAVRLFEAALERPSTPIARLPVLSPVDMHTITVNWDSGHAEYPKLPVIERSSDSACRRPEAPAASFEGRTLTYGELDEQSSRLAHHLISAA